MRLAADGKSLIPTEEDKCRWEAIDIVKRWLEEHPGKIIMLDEARNDLVQAVGIAIWEARGSPNEFLKPPP